MNDFTFLRLPHLSMGGNGNATQPYLLGFPLGPDFTFKSDLIVDNKMLTSNQQVSQHLYLIFYTSIILSFSFFRAFPFLHQDP